tara:strand:- start:254 stop:703 length:450 start_codon:yes stop_codon:yes gene_type:complete
MPGKMDPKLAGAYGKAQEIEQMRKRNPRLNEMSAGQRVKTLLRKKGERGQPKPVDEKTKKTNDRAVADLLEAKGLTGLKKVKPKDRDIKKKIGDETGGPKEDLMEISGQLNKASKLHGNQSKRVAGVAKGMKGEAGNPYMKRSNSKYGM